MKNQNVSRIVTGLLMMAVASSPWVAPVTAREERADQDKTGKAAVAPVEHPAGPHHPPRQGKIVGDHWTPYEPPSAESFPAGSQVHVIVPGDTLWDLSGKYLENPFLWPQIWDVNQYITDSHWIYPGDPLLVPGKPTVIGEAGPPAIEMTQPPIAEATEPERPATAATASSATPKTAAPAAPVLSPIADEIDVNCSSYILDSYEEPDLQIREREDGSRTILGEGDIVFLNKGMDAKLTPGDEFTILVHTGVVPHPIFDEQVGERVRRVGRLKVIALQERGATAEIVQSCDAIEVGMHLVAYEEVPIPIATPVEFRRYGVHLSTENAGYIVDSFPEKAAIADGDLVNIDMGSDSGLRPGDVLTVFREWGGAVQFSSTESYIEGEQARAERHRAEGQEPADFAQTILGQIVVLQTQKHTATGKIVLSTREMALGDRVILH